MGGSWRLVSAPSSRESAGRGHSWTGRFCRVEVSPHPHAVRLHDVDSDGHADLLVDDRSPESIRLFRGRWDCTFSGATSIDVGGDPYRGMSLADVTGDGLADLITPNPDHVAVLVAEEDGGFRPRATLSAPFGPFSIRREGSPCLCTANVVPIKVYFVETDGDDRKAMFISVHRARN